MTREYHFEVIVPVDGDDVGPAYLNGENSATWWEGTCFDSETEEWGNGDQSEDFEACAFLEGVVRRGVAVDQTAIDDLVRRYRAWSEDRALLQATENREIPHEDGHFGPPSPDWWAASDDDGVGLMHEAMALLEPLSTLPPITTEETIPA